jgi:hypothetical protein
MKTLSFLAILFLALISVQTFAQDSEIPKTAQHFDLALAMGPNEAGVNLAAALSWNRTHGLLKSRKLRLGYGLRLGAFGSGSTLTYITAPAKLTGDNATIDSLLISKPFMLNLNASLHIEYLFVERFKAGFNIDAIGIGFGPTKKNNTFVSSANVGQFTTTPTAKPTLLDALLIGDRDYGQLGSEFFVAYAVVPKKLWIRLGAGFIFSEYSTDQKLTDDNNRFRYKSLVGFIGVSYNPFAKN